MGENMTLFMFHFKIDGFSAGLNIIYIMYENPQEKIPDSYFSPPFFII
jgi:hypothetical protein